MDSTIVLIIAVAGLLLGYFAGMTMTARKMKQKFEEQAREEIPLTVPVPSNPETEPVLPHPSPGPEEVLVPPAPSVKTEPTTATLFANLNRDDIATFWREQPENALRVEMDGTSYQSAVEMTPDQRRKLIAVFQDLRAWLTPPGERPPAVEQVAAEPAPAPKSAPAPVPAATFAAPTAAPQAAVPIAPAAPAAKPTTMLGQIDAILQERIAGTPLEKRGIKLMEAPDHSVLVIIGLQKYVGIDAVPDETVRSAIRSAIQEWDKNNN
ncbi:MAG TPA: hypothetical protein PKW33_00185 [Anaerolineaceae bacterium]|nr:hypothetical protein [Anaerolineaceae bacterium]HPN49974.1 hypothetical protein [Anaerolineaceae bacterium]